MTEKGNCWWAGGTGCIHYLHRGKRCGQPTQRPRSDRLAQKRSLDALHFVISFLSLLLHKARAGGTWSGVHLALAVGWGSRDRGERHGTARYGVTDGRLDKEKKMIQGGYLLFPCQRNPRGRVTTREETRRSSQHQRELHDRGHGTTWPTISSAGGGM